MATNKPDTEIRALVDALCEWVVNDLNYMPVAATKLRERFEAVTTSRGTSLRDREIAGRATCDRRE